MLQHPIGRRKPFTVLTRWIRWQLGSRILGWPVICRLVGQTRLIVTPGMHGSTMNLYVGLQEFHEMGFVLHALRPGDLFMDVGANVGVYSILAGGVGAQVIAIEPVPDTFDTLMDNIHLNDFEDRVVAHNIGLSSKVGELHFSTQHGPENRVIDDSNSEPAVSVPVNCLENLVREELPKVVKIDAEGYELEIIKGAQGLLYHPNVLAVILELNGSGKRYGFDDDETDAEMRRFGFQTAHYEPFKRKLTPTGKHNTSGNTLYIRSGDVLLERLKNAPSFKIFGIAL